MRPIARWLHLMSSTVTVEARTDDDTSGYPTPQYAAGVAYRAHLSRKRRLVRTLGGEQVVSDMAVYLATSDAVEPTARLTLSTGDVGSTEATALQPAIVAVERHFDAAGPHHTVLFCGGGGQRLSGI